MSSARRTRRPPLYSMKPRLRKRFMKKLTRDRVVPIISARVPWLTFRLAPSDLDRVPKLASNNRVRANRFSLELKS